MLVFLSLEEVSKSGGPFALEGPPRHRIHGKTAISALNFGEEDVNELLERLRRGECLASEEFTRIDVPNLKMNHGRARFPNGRFHHKESNVAKNLLKSFLILFEA